MRINEVLFNLSIFPVLSYVITFDSIDIDKCDMFFGKCIALYHNIATDSILIATWWLVVQNDMQNW